MKTDTPAPVIAESDPQLRASIGLVIAIVASLLSGWYVITHHAALASDTAAQTESQTRRPLRGQSPVPSGREYWRRTNPRSSDATPEF